MAETYVEGKTFNKIDYTEIPWVMGEYENCTFTNCRLNGAGLSDSRFFNCVFKDCNLSLARLGKTTFNDARFIDCKMLGLRFDHCNKFGFSVYFEKCQLSHSSFFQTVLKKTIFKSTKLTEVDFTECNLTAAVFTDCDLADAKFDNTVIEGADFRASYNYSIDLTKNKVKKAKFGLYGLPGLLEQYDIEIDQTGLVME
ncbi:MAG TPA: pentapeptide repeat-containing protein [Chitinophagaceae bacterium]|jgi:uncharacterized protein YjbI with pentapeptide repeats